jgi:PEP-CTERM motif
MIWVEVTDASGNFLWLSAPRPIVPPGTSFPPGFTDLQSWTRDAALDPDWLRVGTDIVGAGTFNAAFALSGSTVPEPSTWGMMLLGFAGLGYAGWRRTRQARPASA